MVTITFPECESGNPYCYLHKFSPDGRYLLVVGNNYTSGVERSKHSAILVDLVGRKAREIHNLRDNREIFAYWLSSKQFVIVRFHWMPHSNPVIGVQEQYLVEQDGSIVLEYKRTIQNNIISTEPHVLRRNQTGIACCSEYLKIGNQEYVFAFIEDVQREGFLFNFLPKNPKDETNLFAKEVYFSKQLLRNYKNSRLYDWTILTDGSNILIPMIENISDSLFFLKIDMNLYTAEKETSEVLQEHIETVILPGFPIDNVCTGSFYQDADYITVRSKCENHNFINIIAKHPYMSGMSFTSMQLSLTEEQKNIFGNTEVTIHPSGKLIFLAQILRDGNIQLQEIRIGQKSDLQSLRSLALQAVTCKDFQKENSSVVDFSRELHIAVKSI